MLFNSLIFLFCFFPAVLFLYCLCDFKLSSGGVLILEKDRLF